MKLGSTAQTIEVTVRITHNITLDQREAAFLREMAHFCMANRMAGWGACEELDRVLAAAGIPDHDHNPINGLFKERH